MDWDFVRARRQEGGETRCLRKKLEGGADVLVLVDLRSSCDWSIYARKGCEGKTNFSSPEAF